MKLPKLNVLSISKYFYKYFSAGGRNLKQLLCSMIIVINEAPDKSQLMLQNHELKQNILIFIRLFQESGKLIESRLGKIEASREGLPAVIPKGVALQSITLARSARDGFCMNPFRNLRLLTDSRKIHPTGLLIAEREGFEPSIPFRVYTLSRRAR